MRIKHWQGYGFVTAVKKSKSTFENYLGEVKTKLVIEVSGNHEWGLERDDTYDVYHWLLKKFDKNVPDYNTIFSKLEINTNDFYAKKNNIDVEHCIYTITY